MEASDKFFMELLDMTEIAAKFYNHIKGSTSIKIAKLVEPYLPPWINDVMHNSSYRGACTYDVRTDDTKDDRMERRVNGKWKLYQVKGAGMIPLLWT